jgi:hypothetical protein
MNTKIPILFMQTFSESISPVHNMQATIEIAVDLLVLCIHCDLNPLSRISCREKIRKDDNSFNRC